jgi:hypothetical protein
MSLFNQVIQALDNPNQQASTGQVAGILETLGQVSRTQQNDPKTLESALSVVGKYVRSSLQEKRAEGGEAQAQSLVNSYSGTQPNQQAVQALFSLPKIQQMSQEIETRTGINPGTVQNLLPILVPLALNFLKTGTSTQNQQANTVLSSFLDADQDGDVDLADALRMASGYLQKR